MEKSVGPDVTYTTELFFMTPAAGGVNNMVNYSNPEMDPLFGEARNEADDAKLKTELTEIQNQIQRDLAWVPILETRDAMGVPLDAAGDHLASRQLGAVLRSELRQVAWARRGPSPGERGTMHDPASFPALLSPIRLGGAALRNRVVHTSMTTEMAHGQRVTPMLIQYHVNRALGGAAMTVSEPLGMIPRHANLDRPQVWDDRDGDGFRRWAEAVERLDCRLLGQIQDNGRGRHYPGRTPDALSASVLPDDLSWTVPRAMSEDAIAAMIADTARSCRLLQRYGFSGVELSCGHGHLFHQFLSPWTNRREDGYGGDWERRTRLVRDSVAAIRAECAAGFVVGLKLPGDDGVPGGIGPAEAAIIAEALCVPGQVDYVAFGFGAHARSLEMHVPDRFGPRLPYLGVIRSLRPHLNGVPLMATARITDPAEAETLLEQGEAELIGLGRSLIADPAWLNKAAANRTHDIRYCLSCNTCWGTIIQAKRPIACVNNPRVGRVDETDFWPERAAARRRVTVVGAGVAGLEAAWVLAARGHAVTVFGASDAPGGKALLRAPLPGGETITSIPDYQYPAALRAGAAFRLGVVAGLAEVMATEPDVVVLATGAPMIPPDWLPPDIEVPDLRAAMAGLAGRRARQSGTAVIFDADHSEGVYAAALFLRDLFEEVVIITPRDTIGSELHLMVRQGLVRRLAERHVRVLPLSVPVWTDRFEDAILEYENVYTLERGAIEDVAFLAYATPRAGGSPLLTGLQQAGVEVYEVGDCLAPGELLAATASGHEVGCQL